MFLLEKDDDDTLLG